MLLVWETTPDIPVAVRVQNMDRFGGAPQSEMDED